VVAALALAARLVLAAVFVLAAVAKLRDRAGTRQAVVGFGAPAALAGPVAMALPAVEIAVAALLLPATTALLGAIAAAALLAVFSVAIGVGLARGDAPDCHCFGQLHSAPTTWRTLARNGVLLGLAAFAAASGLAAGERSGVAWIGRLDGAALVAVVVGVAAVVLLAAGAFGFLSLLRSYGGVLVRLDRIEQRLAEAGIELADDATAPEIGLVPGTQAPAFAAADATGSSLSLEGLLQPGLPLLLLFTSPHCGPCADLLPLARTWQDEQADRLTLAFASGGSRAEVGTEARRHGLRNVFADEDLSVYRSYEASGTPSAVLIAPDGTVASWVASGSQWIEALAAEAAEEPALPVGSDAPELELESLDGERVSLTRFRGKATLLLFWNPDCGYCRGMHEDLLAWEQQPPNGQPQLVVVSSGEAEATRAEGFRSRVLLDRDYAAGGAFGAGGTPMAVLLDPEGRVASTVVAGADAVLALAAG
jgi:thiol-disulfide isomerase/thioredoxin